MAIVQKFDVSATTKTHGLVDGSIIDLVNPNVPLNSTGELLRMGTLAAVGWIGRGYKESKSFGF